MRLLLDTHVFIWCVTGNSRLNTRSQQYLHQAEEIYVSAASIWEIAIKSRLGKIEGDPRQMTDAIELSGFSQLPVTAVHAAVTAAVDRARAGGGPSLVECLTYRQGGHKRDDPALYRPRDELALWMRRDPVSRMRDALVLAGMEPAAQAADDAAVTNIDDAVAFALASPPATGAVA